MRNYELWETRVRVLELYKPISDIRIRSLFSDLQISTTN